jgi:hypothetical protein
MRARQHSGGRGSGTSSQLILHARAATEVGVQCRLWVVRGR